MVYDHWEVSEHGINPFGKIINWKTRIDEDTVPASTHRAYYFERSIEGSNWRPHIVVTHVWRKEDIQKLGTNKYKQRTYVERVSDFSIPILCYITPIRHGVVLHAPMTRYLLY